MNDGTIQVSVSIYPHRSEKSKGKNAVTGHYLGVTGLFPLGPPKIDKVQFLAIHRCLCATISTPKGITDLIGLAADLPVLDQGGATTWLGIIRAYPMASGFRLYIPKGVWNPKQPMYNERIQTKGIIFIQMSRQGRKYVLLNVPVVKKVDLIK